MWKSTPLLLVSNYNCNDSIIAMWAFLKGIHFIVRSIWKLLSIQWINNSRNGSMKLLVVIVFQIWIRVTDERFPHVHSYLYHFILINTIKHRHVSTVLAFSSNFSHNMQPCVSFWREKKQPILKIQCFILYCQAKCSRPKQQIIDSEDTDN